MQKDSKEHQPCEECELEIKAKFFCSACDEYFCKKCDSKVHNKKKRKDHIRIKLQQQEQHPNEETQGASLTQKVLLILHIANADQSIHFPKFIRDMPVKEQFNNQTLLLLSDKQSFQQNPSQQQVHQSFLLQHITELQLPSPNKEDDNNKLSFIQFLVSALLKTYTMLFDKVLFVTNSSVSQNELDYLKLQLLGAIITNNSSFVSVVNCQTFKHLTRFPNSNEEMLSGSSQSNQSASSQIFSDVTFGEQHLKDSHSHSQQPNSNHAIQFQTMNSKNSSKSSNSQSSLLNLNIDTNAQRQQCQLNPINEERQKFNQDDAISKIEIPIPSNISLTCNSETDQQDIPYKTSQDLTTSSPTLDYQLHQFDSQISDLYEMQTFNDLKTFHLQENLIHLADLIRYMLKGYAVDGNLIIDRNQFSCDVFAKVKENHKVYGINEKEELETAFLELESTQLLFHSIRRKFGDYNFIQFSYVCLLLQNISLQAMVWGLTALEKEKVNPTDRNLMNKIKESFGIKLNERQWQDTLRCLVSMSINGVITPSKESGLPRISIQADQAQTQNIQQKTYRITFFDREWVSEEQGPLANDQESQTIWSVFTGFIDEFFSDQHESQHQNQNQCTFKEKYKWSSSVKNIHNNNKLSSPKLAVSKNDKAIPGGKYGAALFLKHCGPPLLQQSSIGKLLLLVQEALSKEYLVYHKTLLIKCKQKQISQQNDQIDEQRQRLQQIKQAIMKMLQYQPSGMSMSKIPNLLRKQIKFEFELKAFGFMKMKQLIETIPEVEIISIDPANVLCRLKCFNSQNNDQKQKQSQHIENIRKSSIQPFHQQSQHIENIRKTSEDAIIHQYDKFNKNQTDLQQMSEYQAKINNIILQCVNDSECGITTLALYHKICLELNTSDLNIRLFNCETFDQYIIKYMQQNVDVLIQNGHVIIFKKQTSMSMGRRQELPNFNFAQQSQQQQQQNQNFAQSPQQQQQQNQHTPIWNQKERMANLPYATSLGHSDYQLNLSNKIKQSSVLSETNFYSHKVPQQTHLQHALQNNNLSYNAQSQSRNNLEANFQNQVSQWQNVQFYQNQNQNQSQCQEQQIKQKSPISSQQYIFQNTSTNSNTPEHSRSFQLLRNHKSSAHSSPGSQIKQQQEEESISENFIPSPNSLSSHSHQQQKDFKLFCNTAQNVQNASQYFSNPNIQRQTHFETQIKMAAALGDNNNLTNSLNKLEEEEDASDSEFFSIIYESSYNNNNSK